MEKKDDDADVYIMDEIGGWGIDPKAFIDELNGLGQMKTLNIYINSPGGDVFDGMSIYNAIRMAKADTIKAHVTGLAASMASVVMLAASERVMYDGSMVMIHNPWSMIAGNQYDFEKEADILAKLTDQIVQIYVNATGSTEKDLRSWMDDETWMTEQEAIDRGFGTQKEEQKAAASIANDSPMLAHFKKTPAGIITKKEPTIREAEQVLRDAGYSAAQSKAILARGYGHRDDDAKDMTAAEQMVDEMLKKF